MAGKKDVENVCLLCYQTYKPNVQNCETETKKINEQIFVVFLLRNVLEIPKSFCKTLLTTKRNPSRWTFCCLSCSTKVQDLHKVFLELTTIQKKYDLLKKNVKLILKNSNDSSTNDNENITENQIGSVDEIRRFIFSSNEQKDNDPSQDGILQDVTEMFPIKEETEELERADGFTRDCNDFSVENTLIAEDNLFWAPTESANVNWNSDSEGGVGNDTEAHLNETKPPQPLIEIPLKKKRKPETKIRHCSFCEKTFRKSSHLKDHEKIHTGEKPFECPECGKGFIKKSDLRKHVGIHTGDMPYGCSLCDKGYVQKSDLLGHMSTHTGVKYFICSQCGEKFVWKSGLHKHEKIHQGETNSATSVGGENTSMDDETPSMEEPTETKPT